MADMSSHLASLTRWDNGKEIAAFRRDVLKLNQTKFWGQFGVGQSAGSRYEHGRRISKPVQMLMRQAYAEKAENTVEQLLTEAAGIVRSVAYAIPHSAPCSCRNCGLIAKAQEIMCKIPEAFGGWK